jgi:lipoic acid synthetase
MDSTASTSNTADRSAGSFKPLPVLAGAPVRPARRRHPSWIKARFADNERYRFLRERLRAHDLHTVCEEAQCPNIGECWAHGTATFMLLGDVCTRGCNFCAVTTGRPGALDPGEPEKVARVVEDLGLDYVVLTSVNRDDLPDQGSGAFAATIEAIDRRIPRCRIEALVPDFQGSRAAIERVVLTPLFVFAHNVETVPRLYSRVRPGAVYERSLEVLRAAKEIASEAAVRLRRSPLEPLLTKSSLMLGLGETRAELLEVFADLRRHGVDLLTLGQYLQPTAKQLEVFRYVPPGEFDELRRAAEAMGFRQVVSGPLVRSSYHAWELVEATGLSAPPRGGDRRSAEAP